MAFIIFTVLGIGFILAGIKNEKNIEYLLKHGIKTSGIVFELREEAGNSDHMNKGYPVIRFLDENDNWITEASRSGFQYGRYNSGDTVTVLYDRNDPKNFIIDHSLNKYLPNFFLITGVMMILIGVAKFFRFV